jgi:hypothetical protein
MPENYAAMPETVNPWQENPLHTRNVNKGYWKYFYDKAIEAGYDPGNAKDFADEQNNKILEEFYNKQGLSSADASNPIQDGKIKGLDKIKKYAMPLVIGGVSAGLTAKGIDYLFEQKNKKEKARQEELLRRGN